MRTQQGNSGPTLLPPSDLLPLGKHRVSPLPQEFLPNLRFLELSSVTQGVSSLSFPPQFLLSGAAPPWLPGPRAGYRTPPWPLPATRSGLQSSGFPRMALVHLLMPSQAAPYSRSRWLRPYMPCLSPEMGQRTSPYTALTAGLIIAIFRFARDLRGNWEKASDAQGPMLMLQGGTAFFLGNP